MKTRIKTEREKRIKHWGKKKFGKKHRSTQICEEDEENKD